MLFVVDRCSDRTLDILAQIAKLDPRVKVLSLSSRFGHQMSLLAGIDHSSSDALIMMDSDLQHPPSVIPAMLAKFEEGYDIVFTVREDDKQAALLKRVTSHIFYRLINRVSEVPILESAADFRLISRGVASVFQKQIRERNQFLRGLLVWVGFNSTGIMYHSWERAAGKSELSWGTLIRVGDA